MRRRFVTLRDIYGRYDGELFDHRVMVSNCEFDAEEIGFGYDKDLGRHFFFENRRKIVLRDPFVENVDYKPLGWAR